MYPWGIGVICVAAHGLVLPQGRRFWKQSACSPGKEWLPRFPSGQPFLSADL